jgi:hypothetical protein
MESLDIVKYIRPSLCASLVSAAIHTLSFQHTEEAFTGGVVRAAANSTHTGNQVVPSQKALVFIAGELASTI